MDTTTHGVAANSNGALAAAAQEVLAGPSVDAQQIIADPGKAVGEAGRWVAKLLELAVAYLPTLLLALATLAIGWIMTKVIVGIIRRAMKRGKVDGTLTGFVCNMAYMALMTLVVISFVGKLGVQTTSFVAVIGAAGLAIGFALQGSLSNFAAGVMLIVFRPFNAGDFIEAAGTSGIVEELAVFATTLRTPDNKTITVPNGSITAGNITNFSRKPTRRVDLVFGIGYGDDIAQAKRVLQEIVSADPRVLPEPAAMIAVSELGESSVNLVVRPWVNSPDYWNVLCDLTERVKLAFDEHGISIPFPQRDVHLIQSAPAA